MAELVEASFDQDRQLDIGMLPLQPARQAAAQHDSAHILALDERAQHVVGEAVQLGAPVYFGLAIARLVFCHCHTLDSACVRPTPEPIGQPLELTPVRKCRLDLGRADGRAAMPFLRDQCQRPRVDRDGVVVTQQHQQVGDRIWAHALDRAQPLAQLMGGEIGGLERFQVERAGIDRRASSST